MRTYHVSMQGLLHQHELASWKWKLLSMDLEPGMAAGNDQTLLVDTLGKLAI